MKFEDNLMIQFLKKFDENPFLIKINGKEVLVGEGEPTFVVRFNKSLDIKELRRSTSLALGEAYMRGDIEVEGDLFQALDQLLGQMGKFSLDKSALKKLIFTSNSKKNQKDEVSSHYDIGNDFYKLWLDDTLSYSCGYFKNPDDTLYDAQVNKVDYILEKLYLKEGMSLLDIGCGWGFLLIEAAKKYGINGVGITLSREQHKKFSERIAEEGLEGQLTAELMDYRDLPKYGKTFDRIVSVGMVEHVGRENYDLFLSCADKVLNPKGLFLLHYISALEEHPGDPWIKKYIFPGGMIPSLREMISLAASHRFYVIDVESLRRHYTKTLLCWDKGFREHLDEVREMFDDEFIRMWDLYLCSCAATFHNGIIDLSQILMTKGVNNDLPMTRWY
ncbi:SAM-dependent methyltransferase [Eubacterium maltosivorans]|uniref:Class I SAM-dependent methyltransferase n=1 Tax=Eubacterium maltosivorans TaxID=2041044 RepID=A0A4P9CAE4_EUBML|nr:cyclopropane-fatty-acyl-phospholipid synthase family protein [Eubacterium maltosivorans]ALU13420.1 cyclopropane-fatty-acyl-phospholipid synthase [Eubacterium limosum]QCT71672.1 class I SAM-dependent methyltransferase [Eubacterium maltosivorans]